MIRKTALILATALALPLAPLSALASDAPVSPEIDAKIRTTLTAEGYEVRKIKTEDGLFEAYALKDGKKLEIYMNDALEIVKIKED